MQSNSVEAERVHAAQLPPKKMRKKHRNAFIADMKKNWRLHLVILPVLVFFIVFSYFPMIGILTAFMDYRPTRGFFDSEWVGFAHFARLFQDSKFGLVFRNTIVMALLNLSFGFVAPVAFALLLSEIKVKWVNKTMSVMSYLPNFVAPVVLCNLVTQFLSVDGVITNIFVSLGMEEQDMLSNPDFFWAINTCVVIWQTMGYSALVFTAAIMAVNQDLHEAAVLDGANRWQIMWKIVFPNILPLIVMMLVLQVGIIFKAGYDKILLMDSPAMYEVTETVYTYTYHMSFGTTPQYGLGAASGLFQSVISMVLLFASNYLSKKVTDSSLF